MKVKFDDESSFSVDFGNLSQRDYYGPYTVTPTTSQQTLQTSHRSLMQNIIVEPIGSYEDLNDKPKINSVELVGDKTLEELGIDTFTAATSSADGTKGLVPAPTTEDGDKYLKSDGTWATVSGGTITDVEVNGSSVVIDGVAEITVPTDLSDLNNDVGFITSSDIPVSDVKIDSASIVSYGIATIPKSDNNHFGLVKAGYNSDPPAGYFSVDTNGTKVYLPVLEVNYAPDGSGTIRPRHMPDATQSAKGAMTASDKTKLDGIASGAEVNVQSDWNEADSTSDAYIANKPSIPTVPTNLSDLTNDMNVSDFPNDAGYITGYTETDPVFVASDAYGITSSDISKWNGKSDFSGDYDDLTNKPTIPSTAADVGAVPTTRTVNGKALSSDITLSASDISALPSSTVIPTITDTYSGTSSNGMSGKAVKSAIDGLDGSISGSAGSGKTLTAFSQTNGVVSATFGNISITKSQISDFPTIPTVNDATLTIQKNGTTVNTFTANASSNVTCNITVPTSAADVSAVPTSAVGANSGVCPLDSSGKIDASYLPVYNGGVI